MTVHDRMARGPGQKLRRVEPVRFPGTPMELPSALAVEGYPPARVELYLAPDGGEPPRVSVACGGTVVYDDLAEALDGRFRHEPWTAGRVSGLVDFPGFTVAPGSRRGVLLDDAADAFGRAIEHELEPGVRAALALEQQRRAEALESGMVRKLRRVFHDLRREAPEYDLIAVRGGTSQAPGDGGIAAPPGARVAAPGGDGADDDEPAPLEPSLLPPGPLARVEIRPASARVERLGHCSLRARASDDGGQRLDAGVSFSWTVLGAGVVEGVDAAAVFAAGAEVGSARVQVVARAGGREVTAIAEVVVVEELPEAVSLAGIPEPAFVDDARGDWRSRLAGGRWEVNTAHRDFAAAAASPRRKLRYLAALLAKEVVLHSFPVPQGGPLLERLVSVLGVAERGLERG